MKTPVSVAEQTLQIGILGADLVYLLYYVGVGGGLPAPSQLTPRLQFFLTRGGRSSRDDAINTMPLKPELNG